MVTWLTSPTGIFAAIIAIVGLLGGLAVLLTPAWTSWRSRAKVRTSITIAQFEFGELSRSSRSRELRFLVVNSGINKCVLNSIRFVVDAHGESRTLRNTVSEAGVTVHKHRVELEPEKVDYDIRSRAFGPKLPPIALDPGESEAFLVKVVSRKPYWYEVRVVVDWLDTTEATKTHLSSSDMTHIDFPRSAEEAET
jgi:hypothetical protein